MYVMAASALVILVIVSAGYSVIISMQHNPPLDAPVIVKSATLLLECEKETIRVGDIQYELLKNASLRLGIGVKNNLDQPVVIDTVSPKSPIRPTKLSPTIVIPPKSEGFYESTTRAFNQTILTARVKPGDIYSVEGGTRLVLLRQGVYAEYTSSVPVIDPPSAYTPPFRGKTRFQLSVSGDIIYSNMTTPGYAATQLLTNVARNDFLVLAHVRLEEWDDSSDIPFFIDFYPGAQAFMYRASGALSFAVGGSTVWRGREEYIGIHLTSTSSRLFVGNNVAPATTGQPAQTSNINVVVGLAKEYVTSARFGLVAYRLSSYSYHVVAVDYVTGNYVFYDSLYPWRTHTGQAIVYHNIDYLSVTQGMFGTTPVVLVVNPTGGTRDWTFTMRTYEGEFRYFLQAIQHYKQVKHDMLILWGDQANPLSGRTDDDWMDHVVRVTIFKDGTVRVAVFMAKGWFAHDFYAAVENVNPLFGEYVYTKPFYVNWYHRDGDKYVEIPNRIYYPNATVPLGHISSRVFYLGFFKSPVLTIHGLVPGDTVILISANRVVSFTAAGSTLAVDLLTLFGPMELVESLKSGGVTLVIQPTVERAVNLLPSDMMLHVASRGVDTWVVAKPIVSSACTISASGWSGTISLEKVGDSVRVMLTDSKSGSLVRLGLFARVDATLVSFTMTIRYPDGTTETLVPGASKNNANISSIVQAVFYSDRIVLITESGVIEIGGYSSVSVRVDVSFNVRGYFTR